MPWLIFRDSDDLWLRTRSARHWIDDKRHAVKFPTREDAEAFVKQHSVEGKLYYIELSLTECYGTPKPVGPPFKALKKIHGGESAAAIRQRRHEEASDLDPREIEARRDAVRLVMFPTIPGGGRNRRCIEKCSAKIVGRAVDVVAAKLMRGAYRYDQLPIRRSALKDAPKPDDKYGRIVSVGTVLEEPINKECSTWNSE